MKNRFSFLRKAIVSMVIIFIICLSSISASAVTESPYSGYYYDQWGNSRPSPNGYSPTESLTAEDIGVSQFGTVNDMCSDSNGRLYILDSDKSLIYQLDSDLKLIKYINISDQNGAINFAGASGMTVTGEKDNLKIYIADSVNKRILVCKESGNCIKKITKPKTDLLSEKQEFTPSKIIVNKSGNMFVLCKMMFDGAIIMNPDGEFLGFFGSNKVEVNSALLSDYFWKNLLGEKFRNKFARYVPREYTNMTLDEQGFIYTTTLITSSDSSQIRRLNWKSNNVITKESFGDFNSKYGTNKFIDIATMNDGIFAALDSNTGRIFIYGEDGDGITIFGGSGTQDGTFRTPVAIESINDQIYVFDQSTKKITKFVTTDYGKSLLAATRLFLKGEYEKSDPLWHEILMQNNGYEKAYISIGRNLMEKQEYDKALDCFKSCNSRSDYSDAYEQTRSVHMRKYFPIYAVILALFVILIMYLLRNKRSYKSDIENVPVTFFQKFRFTLFHPVLGCDRLICQSKSMTIAMPIILFIEFVVQIMKYQFTGYIFNTNEPGKMDVLSIFIVTFGLFGVLVISNWLTTTMVDGKGKLYQIANVLAFCLIPIIVAQVLNIFLSNILITNEEMFMQVITLISYIWSGAILFLQLCKIHQFTVGRNILLCFLTIVATLIVLIILLLCFSIEKQIEMFFSSVFNEIKMML